MLLALLHTFRKTPLIFDQGERQNTWRSQALIDQKANFGSPFLIGSPQFKALLVRRSTKK